MICNRMSILSQIRKALPELAGLSDEELIGRLEVTRGKTYASDELDSAARRPAYPPEGCTPLAESEQASTRSSQIDQLEDALFLEGLAEDESLSPKERQVVILRISIAKDYDHKATFEELGESMGISKATAEKLWKRACRKLQVRHWEEYMG